MTYQPSELFTTRMIEVLGNWIDASSINAVSAVEGCLQESKFFFIVTFKNGGAIDIESDSPVDIKSAHDAIIEAWDMAIQREAMQKQFERGLDDPRGVMCIKPDGSMSVINLVTGTKNPVGEDANQGVTLSVNMPAGTPKDTIKSAINQASMAILERIDDVGGAE